MDIESIIMGGVSLQVVAPSNAPAFVFTQANSGVPSVSGGSVTHTLCANGLSESPTFPSTWTQAGGNPYGNSAGLINLINIWADGSSFFWNILAGLSVVTPAPTSFVASNNTQTLTIQYSGVVLAGVTPPLSAFTLTAVRPGPGGVTQVLNPYTLVSINPVSAGATSVVLNIAGGTFLDGDVCTLSYTVPSTNPLQDETGVFKALPFTVAAVSVQ
jgi:hypothetical protein